MVILTLRSDRVLRGALSHLCDSTLGVRGTSSGKGDGRLYAKTEGHGPRYLSMSWSPQHTLEHTHGHHHPYSTEGCAALDPDA